MDSSDFDPASERHKSIRVKLEPRRRSLLVHSREQLSPSMVRIVLTSPELEDFDSPSADDHIKLFFSIAGQDEPVMRDFTPRAFDREAQSLTIDFALHDNGPASDWARRTSVGDGLQIAGPRGSTVIVNDFEWYLLIGDETALPAIGRRLAELPATAKAIVIVVVDTSEHVISLPAEAEVTVHWLARSKAPGDDALLLIERLNSVQLPKGDGFVWIAAEAGVAKAVRQHMLEQLRHPKQWLKAAGYWQRGEIGTHEPL